MSEVPAWAVWAALVVMGGIVWLAFLPLWMYNRVKGIERALWAIVSQMQAARREEYDPVQAAQGRGHREAPAPTGMISTSMFGR
ncbi:MAG TPA: hypothetical protein VE077_17680 [Candidatus Methylomirabilis sp.]|nr:hypothetical protein [Candidatus Methylomirabilis sp.]